MDQIQLNGSGSDDIMRNVLQRLNAGGISDFNSILPRIRSWEIISDVGFLFTNDLDLEDFRNVLDDEQAREALFLAFKSEIVVTLNGMRAGVHTNPINDGVIEDIEGILQAQDANNWTLLNFGKHAGKSLPEVAFTDPDWILWGLEKGVFHESEGIYQEAREVAYKGRLIKIPDEAGDRILAAYYFKENSVHFSHVEFVRQSDLPLAVGNADVVLEVVDLSLIRTRQPCAKMSYSKLLADVKQILFGDAQLVMSREICEEFFNNNNNFVL